MARTETPEDEVGVGTRWIFVLWTLFMASLIGCYLVIGMLHD